MGGDALVENRMCEFVETLENGATWEEKELAASALGLFGITDEHAINALLRVVEREYDARVVRAAVHSLTQIGADPIPAMKKRIKNLDEEIDEQTEGKNILIALKMFEIEAPAIG